MPFLKNYVIREPIANLIALKAIDVSLEASGVLVKVISGTGSFEPGIFSYSSSSIATPDDIKVVCPSSITPPAAGRWIREQIASSTSIADAGNFFTSNYVEGALQEIGSKIPDPRWVDIKRLGFVDPSEVTLSFDDSTRIFTIAPTGTTWRYMRNGVVNTITGSKSVVLSTFAGLSYIYIDDDIGTLTAYKNVAPGWDFTNSRVPVATVLYNSTMTPKYFIGNNTYSVLWDNDIRRSIYSAKGTGFSTNIPQDWTGPFGYTVNTDTNAAKQYGIDVANVSDYDKRSSIAFVDVANDYLGFYKTGSTVWVWDNALTMPFFYTNSGYINYNTDAGLVQGQSGKYYITYQLLTSYGFVVVLGQAEYDTVNDALLANPQDQDWNNIGIYNVIVGYKLIWKTDSAYTSNGKCVLYQAPVLINMPIDVRGLPPKNQNANMFHSQLLGNHQGVDINDSPTFVTTTMADIVVTNKIPNAQLANMVQNRVKGRIAASTGAPEDLIPQQLRSIYNDGLNIPIPLVPSYWTSINHDTNPFYIDTLDGRRISISASSQYSSSYPVRHVTMFFNVGDGQTGPHMTKPVTFYDWIVANNGATSWIFYYFQDAPVCARGVSLRGRVSPEHYYTQWKIQGSNNGYDWVDLHAETYSLTNANGIQNRWFTNTTSYYYYIFQAVACVGVNPGLSLFQLWA